MIDANKRENYAKLFPFWQKVPLKNGLGDQRVYHYTNIKESRLYNLIQQKFTEPLLVTTDFDEVKAININKAKFLLWKYFICQR